MVMNHDTRSFSLLVNDSFTLLNVEFNYKQHLHTFKQADVSTSYIERPEMKKEHLRKDLCYTIYF
jgi:hypothetical protein